MRRKYLGTDGRTYRRKDGIPPPVEREYNKEKLKRNYTKSNRKIIKKTRAKSICLHTYTVNQLIFAAIMFHVFLLQDSFAEI